MGGQQQLRALAAVVLTLSLTAAAAAATTTTSITFYVAPDGNDASGDGSIDAPWATVGRAQAAVRGVSAGMTDDIVVYLRGGSYPLTAPLNFTPADSGANGFYVRYVAYPGDADPPVIHGGRAITGWQLVNASTNLWAADMPAPSRQVYINGERANRTLQLTGVPGTVTVTTWGYTTTDSTPLTWAADPLQNVADIELLYTGVGSSWTECRCRIAAITPLATGTGANITMAQPCWYDGVNKYYNQGIGANCARIENIAAQLTTPGTAYINSDAGMVYYVARPGIDNMTAVDAVAAVTEVLLVMNGSRWAEPDIQPVHHVTFEGITWAYATWMTPSTGVGYIDMQSGFRLDNVSNSNNTLWTPVPGNIQAHTVANVAFVGCTFTHLGATALVVDGGSQNVTVANGSFADVSCGGVLAGEVDDWNVADASRQNAAITVFNNAFGSTPAEYHDCAALTGGWLRGAVFDHNTIESPANTGISLGWGWGAESSYSADNAITANYVHNSNWLLVDGGSIYTLGPQPASTVAYNYVSHQAQLYGSLYHDEASAYFYTHHNVVNGGPEWLHIWTSSIHDIVVADCWTNQAYYINKGTNITITNITYLAPTAPFPPAATAIMAAAGVLGGPPKPPV